MKKRTVFHIALFFVIGFASSCIFGEMAYRAFPSLNGQKIPFSEEPQEPGVFPALNDQRVYYQDYKSVMSWLKEAQIVFVGNSRTQFAIRAQGLELIERSTGLKSYNLGFGDDERVDFYLKLFEKHDLWPQTLVINVDDFFSPGTSRTASIVLEENRWEATKNLWEERAGWQVRRRLHTVLPHFQYRLPEPKWTLYRSAQTGAWIYLNTPDEKRPVKKLNETPLAPEVEQHALQVTEKLENEGVQRIILILVPGGSTTRGQAEQLADSLGLSLLAPELVGLTTCDSSHLDALSAGRFSKALAKQFPTGAP